MILDDDDQYNQAIGDDKAWKRLVATDIEGVEEWLVATKMRVQASLSGRKADKEKAGHMPLAEWAEYQDWRRRTTYFLSLLERRLVSLRSEQKRRNVAMSVVSQDHQHRVKWEALITLAKGIAAHEFEDIEDDDLYDLLDTTMIPDGGGLRPVREVLRKLGVDC